MRCFAVCNNSGIISVKLTATEQTEAVAEVREAIAENRALAWFDGANAALQEACGLSTAEPLNADQTLEHCKAAGARLVWQGDPWAVWMLEGRP